MEVVSIDKSLVFMLLCSLFIVLGGCATSKPAGQMPDDLKGAFTDDYGVQYTISDVMWTQHPDSRYRIVAWYPEAGYLVAQNEEDNVSDGGLWTRIDWIPLEGMPPYTWAYCLSAYNAPTQAAAAAVNIAQKDTPRTGCNGFPFSRMKPAMADD